MEGYKDSSHRKFGPFTYYRYGSSYNLVFNLLGFYVDIDIYVPGHIVLGLSNLSVGIDSLGSGAITAWIPVPSAHIGVNAPGFCLAVGFNASN